jgi:hypothetical protein
MHSPIRNMPTQSRALSLDMDTITERDLETTHSNLRRNPEHVNLPESTKKENPARWEQAPRDLVNEEEKEKQKDAQLYRKDQVMRDILEPKKDKATSWHR